MEVVIFSLLHLGVPANTHTMLYRNIFLLSLFRVFGSLEGTLRVVDCLRFDFNLVFSVDTFPGLRGIGKLRENVLK